MQDTKDLVRQTAPWKPGQSWWVVGVQGIIALAIGVFMLANPTGASDVIRFLIALVLLLDSLSQIVDGFRDSVCHRRHGRRYAAVSASLSLS